MANIRISLAEVQEASNRIRNLNASIYDLLQKMKADMNSLDTSWVSDSGNEIRSRFQMFSNRFETQKEVIDSYAGFLDLVVSTYDTNESTMSSNASGIQY